MVRISRNGVGLLKRNSFVPATSHLFTFMAFAPFRVRITIDLSLEIVFVIIECPDVETVSIGTYTWHDFISKWIKQLKISY